jgi:hypothetical protein
MSRPEAKNPETHGDAWIAQGWRAHFNGELKGTHLLKPMRKPTHKRVYSIAAIVILAVVTTTVYWSYRQSSRRALRNRLPKRSLQVAPQGVAEQQMLQGKFSADIPAEQRQIVADEIRAPDQTSFNQPVETQAQVRPGEQQIVITQPLETTVEDTQPTLTWDAHIDGWSYMVRIDDRDSRQIVVKSPILDEALWRIPTPLLRGHSYRWRVDAMPNGSHTTARAAASSTAQFSVLSDEGEQAIQNAMAHNASHLVLGSLYTHYEMWREAVLEYRKLVDEVPDSPEAIKLLRNAEIRSSSKLAGRPAR